MARSEPAQYHRPMIPLVTNRTVQIVLIIAAVLASFLIWRGVHDRQVRANERERINATGEDGNSETFTVTGETGDRIMDRAI